MDNIGIVWRGGQSALGRIRDERLAHGVCIVFLGVADRFRDGLFLSCLCEWRDVAVAVAEWRGGLFLWRLVPVQQLSDHWLSIRPAFHDAGSGFRGLLGLDDAGADAQRAKPAGDGGDDDGNWHLGAGARRGAQALAEPARKGRALLARRGIGTGRGTGAQQDRAGLL